MVEQVRDDINESGMKRTTVLDGGACHRASTPHKSGNKMKM